MDSPQLVPEQDTPVRMYKMGHETLEAVGEG